MGRWVTPPEAQKRLTTVSTSFYPNWVALQTPLPEPDIPGEIVVDYRTSTASAIRSHSVHAQVTLPKAFSVREEQEFLPIQHLMTRLNPQLLVKEVATGGHVDGGGTVRYGRTIRDHK
jgi:hypothetical protein